MKKYAFLLLTLLAMVACTSKLSPEHAKEVVLRGENERLPLVIQTLNLLGVDDVTIDSLVLLTEDEPMTGMLYTTWKKKETSWRTGIETIKEIPIIVKVDSIHSSETQKGYVEWHTRWDMAGANFIFAE